MAECVWAVFCSKTSIDKISNNVSLFSVIEQINISNNLDSSEKTLINLQGELVALFWRSDIKTPERPFGRISILNPNEQMLGQSEFAVDLSQYSRSRHIVSVPAVAVQGAGVYKFRVELRATESDAWASAYDYPFEVIIASADSK